MIKRNLILFLGTAGILLFLFLLSFLPNSSLNIFIKIITLLVVAGWGYYYLKNYGLEFFQEQNRPVEKQTNAIPSSDDDSSNLAGIKVDKSVEEHFNHFLSTIFPLIKQTLVGNTVVLLLFNFYKKRFYRRYQISDFEDQLNPAPFYELSQGLPSLVFKNKQSLLENHLPENKNLLPYYISAELPAKSFLGVPLMLDDYIIGVLCIDSNVPESFSEEDLQILFEFSKIISIQLAESNKLYEYETENWSTHLLYEFSKDILNLPDKVSIWQFLGERLKAVKGADRIVIAKRVSGHQGEITFIHGQLFSLDVGGQFPVNEGLIGWVFRKNQPLLVEDFTVKENYIPRFFMNEKPGKEFKSFLAVPVLRQDNVEAVISMESKFASQFTKQHKTILETMAYQLAAFLDKTEMLSQLQEQNQIDIKTQIGNSRGLINELEKEITRANEFNRPFSLNLLTIKTLNNEIQTDTFDKLIKEFVSFTLPLLKPINYIFRFNNETFAFIWLEKSSKAVLTDIQELCAKITQKKPWVNGLIEKVVVNCGLVEYPGMGKNASELIQNAEKALVSAQANGPNKLEIYQNVEEI